MAGDSSLVWQVFATIIGVSLQAAIAILGWRYAAKNTRDTLDIQELVSNRTTASFIAEKRQKWIDELRSDMAIHIAQSQEIVWKWLAIKDTTAERVEILLDAAFEGNVEKNKDKKKIDSKRNEILQKMLDDFSKENGARDREHQERHIRIKFRLNPKEHNELRDLLDKIRENVLSAQGATSGAEIANINNELCVLLDSATVLTQGILKKEWQRIKQEVAYPESLIANIPKPKPTNQGHL